MALMAIFPTQKIQQVFIFHDMRENKRKMKGKNNQYVKYVKKEKYMEKTKTCTKTSQNTPIK